ncbi:hypothetical protein U1Q18_039319 [Sarracenia purpurea var. burkii]
MVATVDARPCMALSLADVRAASVIVAGDMDAPGEHGSLPHGALPVAEVTVVGAGWPSAVLLILLSCPTAGRCYAFASAAIRYAWWSASNSRKEDKMIWKRESNECFSIRSFLRQYGEKAGKILDNIKNMQPDWEEMLEHINIRMDF